VYRKKSSTALSLRRSGWNEGLVNSSNFFFIADAASLFSSAPHVSGNLLFNLSTISSVSILARNNERLGLGLAVTVNAPASDAGASSPT
jgi:hypothetical protein